MANEIRSANHAALAHSLDRRLFEENPDIDWEMIRILQPQIDAISRELEYDDEYRQNWQRHRFRLAATLVQLKAILTDGCLALELGGSTLATVLLKAHFPSVHWRSSNWDLRLPWPCPDNGFDIIVSMEVFEHIGYRAEDPVNDERASGLTSCLHECLRTLCPGGSMFVSTPNSASIVCLNRILRGQTGVYYAAHFREYSRFELARMFIESGFVITSLRSVHCLSIDPREDYSPLFQLLLDHEFPTEDRGDDWFAIVQKPQGHEGPG